LLSRLLERDLPRASLHECRRALDFGASVTH
jgi:hypothetical protein